MTTQREIELAVLAYDVYRPSAINEVPLGPWEEQAALNPANVSDGFAASVYKNGDEYVIAFRGSDTAWSTAPPRAEPLNEWRTN